MTTWARYPQISQEQFLEYAAEVNSRADVKVAAKLVLVDGVSANKAAKRCRLAQETVSYCVRGILAAKEKHEVRDRAVRVSEWQGMRVCSVDVREKGMTSEGILICFLSVIPAQAVIFVEDGTGGGEFRTVPADRLSAVKGGAGGPTPSRG